MIKFIDLNAQRARISDRIDEAVQTVLGHGKFILGPEVAALEEKLSTLIDANHCITCGNGTDALQIALMALDIGPGDEVITPGFSYIASAEAISVLGGRPVFVDIDPVTYTLCPAEVEKAITDRTKAIIAVSLYGQTPDFDSLGAIAQAHGLTVIEDAAQSFGATYNGRASCNLSTIGCTSFFPTKPLGCYGDGGAIFASDDELAKKLRRIARHGQDHKYFHEVVGVNSRLDTIQAAILLAKLEIFSQELQARDKVATAYTSGLAGLRGVTTPTILAGRSSAWAQYTIRVHDNAWFHKRLGELGVPSMIHYPLPLNMQPAMRDHAVDLEQSALAARQVLSLPMHPYLSEATISEIIDKVRSVARKADELAGQSAVSS